jgi:hypothetical protein
VEKDVEILGFPSVRLNVGFDQPNALLSARLCDIAPDGASRLVSWGLLNLTHREGHETPVPLTPGEAVDVTMQLNVVGYRLVAGHCWRIAISPTYWPHAWPSPVQVKMTLHCGTGSRLVLPVRASGALDDPLFHFDPPEQAPAPDAVWLRQNESNRTFEYDAGTGQLQMTDRFDEGRYRLESSGLEYDGLVINTYRIEEKNPLSAKVKCTRRNEISRGDWATRVETSSVMTSDATHFHVTNVVDAYEGGEKIFSKTWSAPILRRSV